MSKNSGKRRQRRRRAYNRALRRFHRLIKLICLPISRPLGYAKIGLECIRVESLDTVVLDLETCVESMTLKIDPGTEH